MLHAALQSPIKSSLASLLDHTRAYYAGVNCHDLIRASTSAKEVESCALDSTKNEVRCCSDTSITGYKRVTCKGRTLYTESDSAGFGGCQHALTWPQANSLCTSMGARLCTRAEISSQCTRGTGCGHDTDLIWASTSELQSECPALPTLSSRPPSPLHSSSPSYKMPVVILVR